MADIHDKRHIALEAIKLWQGEPGSLEYIGESENYVCSFIASGKKVYLRLTSPSHRTQEQIEAELNFISDLQQGGVHLSAPLVSINGRTLEVIDNENESLFASVFEEAEGESFSFGSEESNLKHFRLRGEILGWIHALSKRHVPSATGRRFQWDEDPVFSQIEHYLSRSETVAWTEHSRLMEFLHGYPRSEESFGLIHGDFGASNFRCRKDRITLFDFDDCCYHWYIYDLAITIYPHGWREGAEGLLDALLEGYSEEIEVDARLRDDIVKFCGLRLLYMFLNYARKWGSSDLSPDQIQWFAQKRDNIARGYVLHR